MLETVKSTSSFRLLGDEGVAPRVVGALASPSALEICDAARFKEACALSITEDI